MEDKPVEKIEETTIQAALELLQSQGYELKQNGQTEKKVRLIEPTIEIESEDLPNGRFYHVQGDKNINRWVPSVTTMLSVIRMGPGFDAWNQNLGHTAPKVRNAKAQQGSDVHYFMVPLMYGQTVTSQDILMHIDNESNESWKWLYRSPEEYTYHIRKYLASFCEFWMDHRPVPVTCEYPIYHEKLKYGGRLDMIVEMKKTKASKKNSRVLIDLKTGSRSKSHALQNSAYKYGWEKIHPDKPIDYIASLYVSDAYRNEPKYDLHYQKFDWDGFMHAAFLWQREASNTKGVLIPSIKKPPPTKFNLYEDTEQEGEQKNGI